MITSSRRLTPLHEAAAGQFSTSNELLSGLCEAKDQVLDELLPSSDSIMAKPKEGRVNPLGYQWLLWRAGNTNNLSTKKSQRDEDERMRIFRELEDSPRVSREELNIYGLPNGILAQRAEVIRILRSMVSKCNDMADMRRRYLWRCLHGYQGKETTYILKKLQEYQEEVARLQDDVKRERGYCPPTPHILTTDPRLH